MSCVSGSTLVAYATILKGVVPAAAAHVLTASLINAPAGILLARILMPRDPTAEVTEDVDLDSTKTYASSIDALMKGTTDGLQIVLAIGATLIVFVALITLADRLLSLLGPVAGSPLSIERSLGLLFSPLAWAMGISWHEAPTAGSLLGVKLVLTEFPAFFNLAKLDPGVLSDRSRLIMTYALCGFGNIASVGINVAGYSVLVPQRREEIMAMVWKALLGGFLASCLTASIVGALPGGLFPQS
jgi:CNT family concentrative nucleoside transporter